MLELHVFVSSPSDVSNERAVAFGVLERLQIEFSGRVLLVPYLWERDLLRATGTFQSQIRDIKEVDLAVFILWARVGTPLPSTFQRPDGTRYNSGTEYEFEQAIDGYNASGAPDVVCYKKTAAFPLSLKDAQQRSAELVDIQAIDAFIAKWFRNPDGSFRSAFREFGKAAEFEDMLETHLREWIRGRLRGSEAVSRPRDALQGSPFRGLKSFGFEDALIYVGRTAIVTEVLEALRARALLGRAFLMVTGMSGVGKSSLIQAGVLPLLMRPKVVEHVLAWRRASYLPNSSQVGLITGFAQVLWEAVPELGEDESTPETLLKDEVMLAAALIRALDRAARKLVQTDPHDQVKLVLVIDQFEEIFDEAITSADRALFARLVRALVLTGRAWVLATLRADFFARCSELPEEFRDLFVEPGGLFTLGGPRPAEIAQIIRRPAAMAGIAFERRSDTDEGLDEVLKDAAVGKPGVLPLLEFVLDELWALSKGSGVLRFDDYEGLGKLDGALKKRADEVYAGLPPDVQASLPRVLSALVHTDATDDRLILQNRAPLSEFDDSPAAGRLIDAFVSARLMVADQSPEGDAVVGLAHEVLLREWPPAVDWIKKNRGVLEIRAAVNAAHALWSRSGRHGGRLLPASLLKDAKRLVEENPHFLGREQRTYFDESLTSYRKTIRRRAVAASLALAAVVVAVLIPTIGVSQIEAMASVVQSLPTAWRAPQRLPLSPDRNAPLSSSIASLQKYLQDRAKGTGSDPALVPWTASQIWIALQGKDPALSSRGAELARFLRGKVDGDCTCWHEAPKDNLPHRIVTAWVIYALADYGQAATTGEIKSMLDGQHPEEGWWSMFPATREARNASTAATAWSLLALNHQMERSLIAAEQQGAVRAAIERGVQWITNNRIGGGARWLEYPSGKNEVTVEYLGVSALAVHVLQTVGKSSRFNDEWLESLPLRKIEPLADEFSKGLVYRSEKDVTVDTVRHYEFPWMLIATADAYGSASLLNRARAIAWVNREIDQQLEPTSLKDQEWTIAEVLLALRHLQETAIVRK